MATPINIVELIEKNPITKLSNTYNTKLLYRLKSNFSDFEQQLFVSSFYCYLNYNKTTDFIVDLDNVWSWIGFQQKYHCKTMLEKNFELNKDYKIIAPEPAVAIKPSENNQEQKKNTRWP